MSFKIPVIERKWFAIAPDGSECDVTLQVGAASQEQSGEWCVQVGLAGLESVPHNIYGVDSWQATVLGMKFVASRLLDFSSRGWLFYWERGSEPATMIEIGLGDELL